MQRVAALDFHAIVELDHLGTHGAEVVDHGGDAVGFLDAQVAGIADEGAATGQGGRHGEHRDFVDEVGDFLGQKSGAGQRRTVDLNVANGLASGMLVRFYHVCPHPPKHLENGRSGRIEADVFEQKSRARQRGGCN